MARTRNQAIGRYLKVELERRMKEAGEIPADLAKALGVTPSTLTPILKHGRGGADVVAPKFAALIGLTRGEFVDRAQAWDAANPSTDDAAPAQAVVPGRRVRSFATFLGMAREGGLDETILARLAAEDEGEDPGEDHWVARYDQLARLKKRIAASSPRAQAAALASPIADERTVELDPTEPIASPSAPARDDAPTSETSITLQAARILPQNTGTPPYELRRLDVSEVRALAVHEAPGPAYEAAPRAELTTFAEFVEHFGPQLGMNEQAIAEVSRDAAATGWSGLIGEEAKRYLSERWDRLRAMPRVHVRPMQGDAPPAPEDGKSERERLREEIEAEPPKSPPAKKPIPKKGPRSSR